MRQSWVGGKPKEKPRSHTVRSGQEPHTPGGTERALRLAVNLGKTAGPTKENVIWRRLIL